MAKDTRTVIDVNTDPALSKKLYSQKKLKADIHHIPKFHLSKDKLDTRDYKYQMIPTSTPSLVDLRYWCSPVENQGALGSCTGQAVAGAIELLNKRNNKPTDVSRLYIYWWERYLMGTVNYDSGAYIRDGIKATNKYGAPLENHWPYIINRFRATPNVNAMRDGMKRRVTLYERVMNFDGCINALSNGYPVIIGFLVYSSFETPTVWRTGMMPYPNISRERLLGGHAVLLVGFDMRKQHFIVRNSWGTNWGAKGYFYMPFDVIKNPRMSMDFWIIKSVQNP